MNGTVLVLTEARRRVEAGWTQNKAYDSRGNVCAGHAIDMAFGALYGAGEVTGDHRAEASSILLQVVTVRTGQFWPSIPDWNDDEGRTLVQVLTAFDEAIALLSEKPDTPHIEIRHRLPEHTALGMYMIPADLEAMIAKANEKVIPIEIEAPESTPIWQKVKDLVGV